MAFLKVLNVHQGDCLTFRPNYGCKFDNDLFFVDLGNGQFDISKEIGQQDNVHLILTHSHRDHIYGISYMFPCINQIKEIILPFCFNEIWLIAKAIMNLKGMSVATECEELKKELIDIDLVQHILRNILDNQQIRITFAYDGLSLCNHIHFWNPLLPLVRRDWLDDDEFYKMEKIVEELFEDDFAKSFINYVNAERNSYGVDHAFNRDFIYNRPEQNYEQTSTMMRVGCQMVLNFIFRNHSKMSAFNNKSDKAHLETIIEQYKMLSHDACLVVMLAHRNCTYLLGGDASKKVFYRLIQERPIYADYFKVPHHGSGKNLDNKILESVSPKVAIISHGNANFGRAQDTHPNQTVLNLLSTRNILTLVTNNVIKKGKVVLKKIKYTNNDLEMV